MNEPTLPNASTCTSATNGAACATAPEAARPAAATAAAPRFRARSTEAGLMLFVEVPGVAPNDLSLHVEDGVLQLAARPSLSPAGTDVRRAALEFQLTELRGRWRLPETVDLDAVTSTLRHGMLELSLPWKKPARRTIPVA